MRPNLRERRVGLLRRRALGFVHDLEKLVFVLRLCRPRCGEELLPRGAAGEADDEILLRQPERAQHVDEHGEQLGIRGGEASPMMSQLS